MFTQGESQKYSKIYICQFYRVDGIVQSTAYAKCLLVDDNEALSFIKINAKQEISR